MKSVFISHSHKDSAFARRLAEDLDSHALKVWIDYSELAVGEPLIDRLEAGIGAVDFFLVIFFPGGANEISGLNLCV